MSVFENVKEGKTVDIQSLNIAYDEDPFENKVNLCTRSYRTERGESWVLPVVRQAEKALLNEPETVECLSVFGLEKFYNAATKLLLGGDSQALYEKRVLSLQTLSGSCSLRLSAELLVQKMGCKIFYVSSPAWENHILVFKSAGFEDFRRYRYWNANTRRLNFEGMLEDLENAPAGSVIVLQPFAHNPTGCDPTHEQWAKITDVLLSRKLIPVLDCAYHGMISGEIEKDLWPVRYLISRRLELFWCNTFTKCFGLYNERVGLLTCIVKTPEVIPRLKFQLNLFIRAAYSNPPLHGARIVAHILTTPQLFQEWKDCLKKMSFRILEMRTNFRNALERYESPGKWEHITLQNGMSCYTGLTEQQCMNLICQYHIYLQKSGRINITCLNFSNIEYVVKCINETVAKIPY
ncbi:aspartate aminotransferase [Holotrichia oblita]|uniref:Aspartate aminotransferase n=1 Tax=Holotrichia oblita TaxID=644536 RepID=A0ACB9SP18_HOLOL|nr:aspartate aminotransferase [Holotrichia oblita]